MTLYHEDSKKSKTSKVWLDNNPFYSYPGKHSLWNTIRTHGAICVVVKVFERVRIWPQVRLQGTTKSHLFLFTSMANTSCCLLLILLKQKMHYLSFRLYVLSRIVGCSLIGVQCLVMMRRSSTWWNPLFQENVRLVRRELEYIGLWAFRPTRFLVLNFVGRRKLRKVIHFVPEPRLWTTTTQNEMRPVLFIIL